MARPAGEVFSRERLVVYSSAVIGLSLGTWLLTIALGHPPAILGGGPVLPDFLAYWTGGRAVVNGDGGSLYDVDAQAAIQHLAVPSATSFSWFVAPPLVAYGYAPIALLPYGWAAAVFCFLTVGMLLTCVRLIRPLLDARPDLPVGLLLLGLAAAPPVFEAVGSGQNSPLLLLLWTLALRSQMAGRSATAGALLALSAFKPQLVLLIPVLFALRRQWRALTGFVGVAGFLCGLCVVSAGMDSTRTWLRTLGGGSFADAVERSQSWKMESLSAFLTTVTRVDRLDVVVLAVGVAIMARWVRTTSFSPLADMGFLAAVTVACAPHVMLYDGVLLLLTIVWIAVEGRLHEFRWILFSIWLLQFLTAPRHLIADLSGLLGWLQWPWPALAITTLCIALLRAPGDSTTATSHARKVGT